MLIRYFAGARAAATVASETISGHEGPITLGDALSEVELRHGAKLAQVLGGCSFLVDGVSVRDRSAHLPANCTIDVLPPFAGG